MATQRQRTNKISRLLSDDGALVEDFDGLYSVAKNYFDNLFTAPIVHTSTTVLEFLPQVSRSDNVNLLAPLTFDEFERALKQMQPNKSSGLMVSILDFFNIFCQFWVEIYFRFVLLG